MQKVTRPPHASANKMCVCLIRRATRHQVEELIKELGMGLSGKKLKKAMAELDPAGEGVVWRDDFISWYAENGQQRG